MHAETNVENNMNSEMETISCSKNKAKNVL